MGYDQRKLMIVARVSRHNDERDEEHDRLWEKLREEVETLCERPEYQEIDAMAV